MVSHAAASRQDGHIGQTFRQHPGHFGHSRTTADGDGIDAAKEVVEQKSAAAAQFFFRCLIAVTVTGNDVDILQAQLLANLALHVI